MSRHKNRSERTFTTRRSSPDFHLPVDDLFRNTRAVGDTSLRKRKISPLIDLASDEEDGVNDVRPDVSSHHDPQPVAKKIRPSVIRLPSSRLRFEDGQLVVAASDGLLFNVHKGVLKHHSTVIAKMIANAEAKPGKSRGQQFVLDIPERGDDLGLFFQAIYDGGKSPYFNRDSRIDFRQLRTLLLLATKYNVPHLAEPAIYRLRKIYPSSTLVAFESTEDLDDGPVEMSHEDHLVAVVLARTCNLPDIVPVAYYRYMVALDNFDQVLDGTHYSDELIRLSSADTKLFFTGMQQLLLLTQRVRATLLEETTFDRIVKANCGPRCLKVLSKMAGLAYIPGSLGKHDGLSRINAIVTRLHLETLFPNTRGDYQPVCVHCTRVIEKYDIRREEMWAGLGAAFDVAEWPIL